MALSAIFMSSRVHVGCLKRRDGWKTRSTLYKHLIYLSLSKACSNTWWTAPKTPAQICCCVFNPLFLWLKHMIYHRFFNFCFSFCSLPVFILLLLLFLFTFSIFCVFVLLVFPHCCSFSLVLLLSLWSKRRKRKTEKLQNKNHFEKIKPGMV